MDYQATPDDDRIQSNEEGEFELVLGNKQLLSVFFVAVLLLGVFFIMGYIVGRNLSPEPPLVADASHSNVIDVEPAATAPAVTAPVTPPPPAKAPEPEPAKPAAMPDPPKPVAAEPKQPPTQQADAKQPPKPEPSKPEPPKPAATKPEPPKQAAAKPVPTPKPVEPAKPPVAAAKPPVSGSFYLQVAAATPDKVNGMIAQLKGKGFATTTQQVPNSELVRILVGPYDANGVTDGAAKLKSAGYDSIRKKL